MEEGQKARAIEIFARALDVEAAGRTLFVERSCDGDPELRLEVLRLLDLEERSSGNMSDIRFQDELRPVSSSFDVGDASWSGPAGPAHETGAAGRRRSAAAAGERIGPYRVLNEMGSGGMGTVYLAEQIEPVRRRVALKVIKLGMDTKEIVARFEAERQALALMEHPSIARVYDAGATDDGRPYFVMEFVQGLIITDYCDQHKLTVRERLELFVQVCEGISHAHHRGIIHRDIKPSNILVSTPDQKPTAKIIDFGIAKATNQRLTEKTLYTELGRTVGTPAYMSPEQAETTGEDVDHRSDIYSLGVLLYELLVGELPLDWDSLSKAAFDEVMRRIREEDPPTPSMRWSRLNHERTSTLARQRRTPSQGVRGELRGELDWITMKALEKERERRYATAAQLAEDVSRYLGGEPVRAGPPGLGYTLRKFVRRNRTVVRAVAAVFLALLIGIVASLYFALQSRHHARIAGERLDQVLRLTDFSRLEEYEEEARGLWPELPGSVAAMESWLEKARAIAQRFPVHKEELENLRRTDISVNDTRFSESKKLQQRIVSNLVTGLESFTQPRSPPSRPDSSDPWKCGTLASVEGRLEWAKTIVARSIESHRAEWDEARASIRDPSQCRMYRGLELQPQVGLVPIGRDPLSGLWEFWHVRSGDRPARRENGRFELTERSGIVLVLVPGGTFLMGSPAAALDPDETPAMTVHLEPFFISKYEMTQGQWLLFTGEKPSLYEVPEGPETLLHPVENVPWSECEKTVGRLALELPTEAQWEYAGRAGTTTMWWVGDSPEDLLGAANLADRSLQAVKPEYREAEAWDDGFRVHAAVGKLRPNSFGLHDTAGNVEEWCRDSKELYGIPPAPGDGLRKGVVPHRVFRGGSWYGAAFRARSATRQAYAPEKASPHIGVRPSRRIER